MPSPVSGIRTPILGVDGQPSVCHRVQCEAYVSLGESGIDRCRLGTGGSREGAGAGSREGPPGSVPSGDACPARGDTRWTRYTCLPVPVSGCVVMSLDGPCMCGAWTLRSSWNCPAGKWDVASGDELCGSVAVIGVGGGSLQPHDMAGISPRLCRAAFGIVVPPSRGRVFVVGCARRFLRCCDLRA